MQPFSRAVVGLLVVSIVAVGCVSPRPTETSGGSQAPAQGPTGPKRIVAGMQGRPVSGYARMNVNNSERGNNQMADMLHSPLVVIDPSEAAQPKLADAVPTVENGLWKVFPDGRMETTLKIHAGAEWHDRTPLTAHDLVWTFTVLNDREFPIFRTTGYSLIDSVEAVDRQTLLTRWRQPFIRADQMWSENFNSWGAPLPKHILETPYAEDKLNFLNHPYFTEEFVGTGPFTLKEWETGSRVVVQANDRYVLGRPKVDEIEVRTIPDVNVIVANLLSGSIDLVIGRTLTLDNVLTLRERIPDIQVETPLTSMMVINSQFLYDTNPAILRDLTFRKALVHAIDRQALVEGIGHGLVPIAHGVVYPTTVEGQAAEQAAVRYEFDPRRSAQMIEGLGMTKGPDGFYRDPAGQPMKLEVRATNTEINTKTMYASSDSLQRAGIAMDPVVIPGQLVNDQEYRAKFPALIINGGGAGPTELESFHSEKIRTAATGYAGANRAGYRNAELDSFIDRYTTTIPQQPRMELVRQITRHVTENLPQLPLFFDTWPGAASPRLVNVRAAADGSQTWNIQEWDVR